MRAGAAGASLLGEVQGKQQPSPLRSRCRTSSSSLVLGSSGAVLAASATAAPPSALPVTTSLPRSSIAEISSPPPVAAREMTPAAGEKGRWGGLRKRVRGEQRRRSRGALGWLPLRRHTHL